jgi:16S rRNA (guanine966-N2)-methyltransferase
MRIIAGKYGSRKLKSLDGLDTRPTLDRVKESLFNILGKRPLQAQVLDLFSGSGSLGLEALSRGAQFCVLNDASPEAVEIIQDNVEALKVQDDTGVMCQDAFAAVDILADAGMAFDLIFLDPPYDAGLYAPVLEKIRDRGILAPEGMIVCEHRRGSTFEIPYEYRIYDRRTYGRSTISFIIEEVVN